MFTVSGRRWLLAIVLGVTWLPRVVHAEEYKPPFDLKTSEVVAAGQTLFNLRCAGRCHGVDGQEGFDAPILTGRSYLTPSYALAILLAGRPGTAMPGWQGRLSDGDLWKIIAFLSSLGDRARGTP
ncbi:MAG: cytochrome c [Candidatus Rokubacteria bacterium]|nr:cytochrome c [Candidatus Rokubacteria bacterium]